MAAWHIPYVNLGAQFVAEKAELMPRIEAVLASGMHVGGAEVEALEQEIAAYVGTRHAVALNSGTDALIFSVIAAGIGPGAEVITPPNSFVASTAAIAWAGATPVFADVRWDGLIDPEAVAAAVTPRTAAIMPVHLWGGICDMDALWAIAERHGLAVIEDAAQAMGTRHRNRRAGALGTVGCFSAHPLKIFNAVGDAGFVTTDSDDIASRVRLLRNHGLVDRDTVAEFATVSRLDALQAAVLRFRLGKLEAMIERRRANADRYRTLLAGTPIKLPQQKPYEFHTFVNFVSQCERRDELQQHLAGKGVQTVVHYNTPIHLQPAAGSLECRRGQFPVTERLCETILALPANQTLAEEDVRFIAAEIRAVLGQAS
ncbi:MAG: DegT/DnrJ/EryC1/StrS family aminotransferase [Xanthobacteraceae bacterium]